MKVSRVIQFVLAVVLYSIGCVALLANAYSFVSTICFTLPAVILMRRSEMTRPIPIRELWIVIAILAALVALIILANSFIPKSAGEHLIRRPAFVIPLWAMMTVALFWRWLRERRFTDAQKNSQE
jgi:uncharacterized membrane protein